jgi:sugar phosphate isomerase/epimerase
MEGGMRAMTRREVMRLAAVGGVGTFMGSHLGAKAPQTLGVQLYSVRDQMAKDPEGTLKAIADIGYREVEALRGGLPKIGALARSVGLSPISVHVDTPLITGKWDAWQFMRKSVPEGYDLAAVITDAKAAGAKFLVCPYLMPPERPKDAAGYSELAATLNRAGEQITKAGLTFCYHNHAFEFAPLPDGRTPLDLMMAETRPELVKLELDAFWTSVSGNDPVAILKKYSGRVPLLHLKDKQKGAPTAFEESKVPPTTFVPVGSGAVDFPALLAAAPAAGVQHYFVEQDHAVGSTPLEAIAASFKYLRSLP